MNTPQQLPLLCILTAVAACGDNLKAVDAGPMDGPVEPSRAVVVAGDFTAGHPGVLTTLDLGTGMVRPNVGPAMAVGNDPILRHVGNELFIVNRSENNVTILDDETLAFKEQISTGPNSNPQDVAVAGNKLFVATYGTKGVTVLTRGSNATTEIDLSADDPDGKPECSSLYLVGNDLYVACQLLAAFQPVRPGRVYVVDASTNAPVPGRAVTLTHMNPITLFERIPPGPARAGDLVIGTVENFTTAPGCIERIVPGATPVVAGCMVDNTKLGGYATRITFEVLPGGGGMMWIAAAVTDFRHANMMGYDLTISTLWDGPVNPSNQVISDVVHCPSGEVVAIDATANAGGLRVYRDGIDRSTAVMPIGLGSYSQHGLVCY